MAVVYPQIISFLQYGSGIALDFEILTGFQKSFAGGVGVLARLLKEFFGQIGVNWRFINDDPGL